MSNCPPMTFEGISAAQYAILLQTAQSQGLNLTGESGSTSYQGMDFTWNYDQANQTLAIQCTGKPIFIPCSMIEAKVRSVVG
ncbi:hypothetical protein [Acidicapsa ligni]|uniref:hypothetical protein n=1 Tax=Acidicapsa ligni TaxID=542300 RepID=UPI0021DF63C9|nr:hypothetical protein [Acidicapsa ligni]